SVPLNVYLDAQSVNHRTTYDLIDGAYPLSSRSTLQTRRGRPPLEIPEVSNEILEAKARARSLAAARAARASVLARKAKAERCAVEQRARVLRTQLIARRRLYLSLARALADEAVDEQKRPFIAADSESMEEEDSESPRVAQGRPRVSPVQTPGFPVRRPRGRPPTSGRYRMNRGLRRPLAASQVPYPSAPSDAANDGVDKEEQENKPEWTLNRGASTLRPRGMRRGSTPGRRGRPRGGGVSRPILTPRMPEALLPKSPLHSPTLNEASDDSSTPSTPSTCPALGDSRLEAILTMPDEEKTTEQPPYGSVTPERSAHTSRDTVDFGRGHRGTRRRTRRPFGRGCRGAARRPLVNVNETPLSRLTVHKISSPVNSPPPATAKQQSLQPQGQSIKAEPPTSTSPDESADIYCLCRTPYDPGRVYIACDRCDEWYHAECVGLTSQQAATHAGTYICPRCTDTKVPDVIVPDKLVLKQEPEPDESDGTTKTLYDSSLTVDLQSQLCTLLRDLQEHKMAWPFLHLPSPTKYPAFESLEDPKSKCPFVLTNECTPVHIVLYVVDFTLINIKQWCSCIHSLSRLMWFTSFYLYFRQCS
ncbi:unnamed protein product, partial [Echinostoma caproni]|uniref:PHD-type domain-containing protein n=1 Tax=Echinostoma caproni TaxID=27848 RepID=A0A183B8X5_9TREM